jgi:hypothetical protein
MKNFTPRQTKTMKASCGKASCGNPTTTISFCNADGLQCHPSRPVMPHSSVGLFACSPSAASKGFFSRYEAIVLEDGCSGVVQLPC